MFCEFDEVQFACLLASYEADEPHVSVDEQHYPVITKEEFSKWLVAEHHGDCTNQPSPCVRCLAERVAHKAKWLIHNMLICSEPTTTSVDSMLQEFTDEGELT